MILYRKLALIAIVLVVAFSCKKEEIPTNYADKLMGYYIGNTEQYDTLTIEGKLIPMRYVSHITAYIQRNKESAIEIMYFTNFNHFYTGTAFSNNGDSDGLIESISLSKENLLFINDTTVNFWGRSVSLKGNGTYNETNRNLTLNLEANDNGKIRKFVLTLVRQKRLNED